MEIKLKQGQCVASKKPKEEIVVRSIGTGIALVFYDEINHVGGAGHFILPAPSKDGSNAEAFPRTGVPILLDKMKEMGADPVSLSVKMIGGAEIQNNPFFNFGKKIRRAAIEALEEAGLAVAKEATGGSLPRNVRFSIGTGKISLETMSY